MEAGSSSKSLVLSATEVTGTTGQLPPRRLGALRALVPQQSCQALLEIAPGHRVGFEDQPLVSQMRKGGLWDPAIPLLGECPEELKVVFVRPCSLQHS